MAPRLRTLLLLLPAGCAAPGPDAAALQRVMENGRASLDAVAPAAVPAALPLPAAVHLPPRAAARLPASPPATAAELLGAGPEVLRRRLGEPALRRHEGGAEVWLYAGAECALDLILYPAGGALRVAHAAARASGTEAVSEAACLSGIAAPRGGRGV